MFDLRSFWHHHGGIPLLGEMSVGQKGSRLVLTNQNPDNKSEIPRVKRNTQTKCLGILAPPRRIELLFSPWEGDVLAAWPWGRLNLSLNIF